MTLGAAAVLAGGVVLSLGQATPLAGQDPNDPVGGARHAYYAMIVRANLIYLAYAESSYYEVHRGFAIDLDSLRTPEGAALQISQGLRLVIDHADSVSWRATGRSLTDTTVVCSIEGRVSGATPERLPTHCH